MIDEAGAARILPKSRQKKIISKGEIEDTPLIARIPPASVSSDDRGRLQTLDRDLKATVFGQDPAIEALAAAIKMARSASRPTSRSAPVPGPTASARPRSPGNWRSSSASS